MNRSSQRGAALVITLIMLSLVTLMAVVFLSISRREKASVTVTQDQTDARLMADAATERAKAEVIARMLATTNPFNYDLMVPTNFINPAGFQRGVASPLNVSYTYPNGQSLSTLDDQLQNLANLQYDPRPPVYVPTNRLGATEFRYSLDLNRNGLVEPNGVLPVLGPRPGEYVSTNGGLTTELSRAMRAHFVGDPEWIGVLEHPDRRHSDSNLMNGRYTFVVLPAGKSLDLNFIHNNAKFLTPNLTSDGFRRNTGFGSWELNLAGFLRDLNTNSWTTYNYQPLTLAANTGFAFEDARALLAKRYVDAYKPVNQRFVLDPVSTVLGPQAATAFRFDGLDNYGDGTLLLAKTPNNLDLGLRYNPQTRPWPGSPNPSEYYDAQELFDTNLTSFQFVRHLLAPTTNTLSSYDRYTFYRSLAQLGTDSRPAESNRLYQSDFRLHPINKFHLNYRNDIPGGVTNFISWDPSQSPANGSNFFHQVADRLFRANLRPRIAMNPPIALLNNNSLSVDPGLFAEPPDEPPVGLYTHFVVGTTPVRREFSLHNIQLHYFGATNNVPFYMTNNEYSATVHQLLQQAANIYDATTTRRLDSLNRSNDYPTVFRPTFVKTSTNVYINGYVEENGTNSTIPPSLLKLPWMTADDVARSPTIPTNTTLLGINIYGAPAVIGAKKGYPNFNELSLETAVQVSRKLEVRKLSASSFQTNQMYVLGISNIFGVEGWNSYTQNFQRPFELHVTNRYWVRLNHVVDGVARTLRTTSGLVSSTIATNFWTNRMNPNSFMLPIHTNVLFLTNSAYLAHRFPFLTDPSSTNSFENSFDPPQWFLVISNRLQYVLVDKSVPFAPRIVDLVNLDNVVTTVDISGQLVADSARTGGRFFSSVQVNDADLWNTNRPSAKAPTAGIVNQIRVALGDPNVSPDVWRSYVEDPIAGGDKQKAIQKFQDFFRSGSTNLVMQVPFTPTRKIYQRTTWQANDPLVHYTLEDLTDPVLSSSVNNAVMIRPPNGPLPQSNLGLLNERYRPWGGNPNKNTDDTAFRMTLKDPLVRSSDDWDFPTNKLPNVGWLGRVHRGTPWQTVYLKAGVEDPARWLRWSGSLGTHPTNDWKLLDLFTIAPSANAARGLLSVNQTNLAAWSACLSGVAVLSNSLANPGPVAGVRFDDVFVQPSSPQLQKIVDGINRTKLQRPRGVFKTVGEILATPELTMDSPFLNLSSSKQIERGLTDAAVERIPQQILSLLKTDEPRIVVYAFGQSLKPAERSLVTYKGFYNICTNYQITGEFATKTVLRIEDAPQKPRAVVESFTILPPE